MRAVPFNEKPSREAGFLRSEGAEWENKKIKVPVLRCALCSFKPVYPGARMSLCFAHYVFLCSGGIERENKKSKCLSCVVRPGFYRRTMSFISYLDGLFGQYAAAFIPNEL